MFHNTQTSRVALHVHNAYNHVCKILVDELGLKWTNNEDNEIDEDAKIICKERMHTEGEPQHCHVVQEMYVQIPFQHPQFSSHFVCISWHRIF